MKGRDPTKIRKRILAALTAAVVCITFISGATPSVAKEFNLAYPTSFTIDTDNLISSGDYRYGIDNARSAAVIFSYNGSDSVVNIPAELDGLPVIGIANGSFSGNCAVTRVVIPFGVEFIGTGDYDTYGAFAHCTNLTSVSIPDSVWFIGTDAFMDTALRSVTIPDSVTELYGGFKGCTSLMNVKLSEGLTYIAGETFKGCTSLRSIRLPSNIDNILGGAFEGCTALSSVIFPETMTMSRCLNNTGYQFKGCTSLTNVVLPDSMMCIPTGMFANSALKTIHIGDNVTSIAYDAFDGCTLSSLSLPDRAVITENNKETRELSCNVTDKLSVPFLGYTTGWVYTTGTIQPTVQEVRGYCTFTRNFISADNNSFEASFADGVSTVYSNELKLIPEYGYKTSIITLPDTVTRIIRSSDNCYLSKNYGSMELTIGGGLIDIEEGALDFQTLSSINVSKANIYTSYDGVLFRDSGRTLAKFPSGYDSESFSIPYGTTKIANGAFKSDVWSSDEAGTNVRDIYIPETVTEIGENNFEKMICSPYISTKTGLWNVVIHGKTGSEAERYAAERGIPFVADEGGTDTDKKTYTETVTAHQTITRDNTNFTQPVFSGDYGEVTGTLVYTDDYGSVMTYEGVRAMLANFRSGTYTIGYRFTPDADSVYGGEKTGTITLDMTRIPVSAPVVSYASVNGSLLLSWQPVENAIAYEINLVNDNGLVKVGDTTQTSYAYSDIEENKSYSFVVRAFDGDSFSDYSEGDIITAVITPKKPETPFDGITVVGHSLQLNDCIGVNFYLDISDEVLSDDSAKLDFEINKKHSSVPIYSGEITEDGRKFTCYVAPAEVTDTITCRLYIGGKAVGEEFTYSAGEYANHILENPEKFPDEVPLVKAMLNYSARSQLYFGHNTHDLANALLDESEKALAPITADELSSYAYKVTDADDGIDFIGQVLRLTDKVAAKFYFSGDVSAKYCTVNGAAVSAEDIGTDDKGTYIVIRGIAPGKYDEPFEIKAGNVTVSNASVYSYLYTALKSSRDDLYDLTCAMYAYNNAAKAYTAN